MTTTLPLEAVRLNKTECGGYVLACEYAARGYYERRMHFTPACSSINDALASIPTTIECEREPLATPATSPA